MSWYYRNVLGKIPRWETCCDAHDRAYGPGGNSNARAMADKELFVCVAARGDELTAAVMWLAVRLGGTPFYPVGWRWGYERDYGVSWWYERSNPQGW